METEIAINSRNAARIGRIIQSIEGSSDVRTLTYDAIIETCKAVEDLAGISKADLLGTEVLADVHARDEDDKSPMTTVFRASKTPSGWRLTEVSREFHGTVPRASINYSEKARSAIVARYSRLE